MDELQVTLARGTRDAPTLKALADLRVSVFAQWPYLYEGSAEYEAQYLESFLSDPEAVLIVAMCAGEAIGMATASRLSMQSPALVSPLREAGLVIESTFYFGESVLLSGFRGRSIGHAFFDQREAAAREAGASTSVFCAVARDPSDPRRPVDARDSTSFWSGRGYAPLQGAAARMDWAEPGTDGDVGHDMHFWSRDLRMRELAE